ncbi:OLC1v1034428C1 [Oldenlandia corymbosa var. corymbosa]|uniref:OLC1v1034428C1 n=1 Tax=Oldenlandia corymbosa var. corymbosa TaxID=529605 RepID=A0AAV1CQI5_OLDCO|nr:OLC1v1034428C1 [Oldenlandia corymbosa var. corymbosa]
MSSKANHLHFILFPLMAPGHMIPMIDIAKLLAQQDVAVTIVTTPSNAQRFGKTINRATESGLRINLLEVHFPSVEAGLPEGCENLDSLPSLSMAINFFMALNLFRQEVERTLLTEVNPKPSCIISDMGLPWTNQIAKRFQIPRIVFHGTCCFSLLCSYNVLKSNICQSINTDTEYFVVPGLPDKIEVTKAQILGTTNANSSSFKEVTEQIREAEETSYGVIVNSFEELEPNYVEEYRKARGKKVWCIGPVSLCNVDNLDKAQRGNRSSIDQQYCLDWLNSHDPRSVIYASFGSLSRLSSLQMMELALGLEASNKPFIWAFGKEPKSGELDRQAVMPKDSNRSRETFRAELKLG